jgi:GT2 family glycosyltransferase
VSIPPVPPDTAARTDKVLPTLATGTPAASVIIATRNRKLQLRDCIESVLRQTVPVEVIVLDDGSDDGTPEMVAAAFPPSAAPQVRYERFAGPSGPCMLRNRGCAMARSNFLFPIDDDTVMISTRTVEQTLAEFTPSRTGAVGIPFINVRADPERRVLQRAPGEGVYVASAFVGCAHAVRRDVFLHIDGYRERFFYMGEEADLCLRMLAAGYITRLGNADPIHHFESPSRSHFRADFYGRRNDVLFAWHNVPMPALAPHLLATTANGIAFGLRCGRVGRMVRGLASGYLGLLRHPLDRDPVSGKVYRLARELKKRGAIALADIVDRLPPPAQL